MSASAVPSAVYARSPRRRTAYTLVEMLVSATAMSVLTAGIASTIILATQAVEDVDSPSYSLRQSTLVLDEFARDVGTAIQILEASNTAFEFVVPDRDGDGQNETIRYVYPGAVGDPLTRQINGGAASAVLENVQGVYVAMRRNQVPNQVESEEQLLIEDQSSGNSRQYEVDHNDWVGQYFCPEFDDDVISWNLTRIEFHGGPDGSDDGTTLAQIRTAGANGVPTDEVLEEVRIAESSLGYIYNPPEEISFSNVRGLAPGEALCLVFVGEQSSDSMRVHYQNSGAYTDGTWLIESETEGASWNKPSGQSIWIRVHGTVVTEDGLTDGTKLEWMQTTLLTHDDLTHRIEAAVQCLNRPEIPE